MLIFMFIGMVVADHGGRRGLFRRGALLLRGLRREARPFQALALVGGDALALRGGRALRGG